MGEANSLLNPNHVRDRFFYGLLKKAGLRRVRFHDLRHSFASLLLQQGESPVYVKEQLGHSSIQITVDCYGHLIPGGNKQAVDKLDQILAAISGGSGSQEGNHTLRWDQVIPAATRFVVLSDFGGAAVRDNETGLVWERSPLTTLHPWDPGADRFNSALAQCADRTTGGRKG